MKIHVNRGEIEIVAGDITLQETAAVVNAANNHFWMGGGVAGAIKRAGGASIESEAISKGPVEVGEAVLTGGGSLKARYVIHAAVMGQDLHTDESKIRNATRSALKVADKSGVESVSFPALGTGVGGFSVHHCARIMIEEAVAFLSGTTPVRLVRFVLFDAETAKAFEDELRLQFSTKRHH
ncbi:MAG TPA: macro domain-containing protein [Bacteroidota bacterium]|nr:macro domain-containing protein [Bacteroidota bacterium]